VCRTAHPNRKMTITLQELFDVPESRRAAIRRLQSFFAPGRRVALSTHVNADGDGCGSETALARILLQLGMKPVIVNPTPWPRNFDFLLDSDIVDRTPDGVRALDDVDLLIVLDISDVSRLGVLAEKVRSLTIPIVCVDHHQPGAEPPGEVVLAETTACATGELVFDIARELDVTLTRAMATSLYTAILTDTGGFRFSNTTPRCHAVAGALLAAGVEPEEMYRQVYASVPVGRLHLLRDALTSLEVDQKAGLSWMAVTAKSVETSGIKSEDMDGLVEHARSIKGTKMALFFRDLGHGKVKISFRSAGEVDVNGFARNYGGGGHTRAAGAMVTGKLDDVVKDVVGAAREFLLAQPAVGGKQRH
jgi:phosphoesterase RecJ-like protein